MRAAKEVLDRAMALPEKDRRRIAKKLLESVEPCNDLEFDPQVIDPELAAELARRLDQLDRGEVELLDWSEVHAELKAYLLRKHKRRTKT